MTLLLFVDSHRRGRAGKLSSWQPPEFIQD